MISMPSTCPKAIHDLPFHPRPSPLARTTHQPPRQNPGDKPKSPPLLPSQLPTSSRAPDAAGPKGSLAWVPSAHPSPCPAPLCHSAPSHLAKRACWGKSPKLCSSHSVTFFHPGEENLRPSAVSTCHHLSGACVGLGASALDCPSLSNSRPSPCFRHSLSAVQSPLQALSGPRGTDLLCCFLASVPTIGP